MFKLFKGKKKSKKDKESSKAQQKEHREQQTQKIVDENNKENSPIQQQSPPKSLIQKEPLGEQSPQQHQQQVSLNQHQELNVEIDKYANSAQLASQPSTNVTTRASQSCQASPSEFTDSMHESFHHTNLRDSQMSNTFSGDHLNRYLTSGYLTGDDNDMGYLKRPIDIKTPTSPHFHRPANFSYSNPPNVLNVSSNNSKKGTLSSINTTSIRKSIRNYSTSPTRTVTTTITTTTIPAGTNETDLNEEPIRLSKYSGGYVPDPKTPRKIETLDWPSPPYIAAVPELRSRSRSSSNRNTLLRQQQQQQQSLEDDDVDAINSNLFNLTKSVRNSNKIYRKIYDNEYDDYLRFKRNKPDDDYRDNGEESNLSDNDDNVNNNNSKINENLVNKLKELESKSGLAKELVQELNSSTLNTTSTLLLINNNKQKLLDPIKSARDPSAKHELNKTRFSTLSTCSSPSRALYSCRSTNDTPTTTLICSTPRIKQQPQQQQQQTKSVPKPGYGLLNPKSVTLPSSTRYLGLSSHRSVDFVDSPNGLNYPQNADLLLNEDKNTNYVTHATRSTPNLIGTPKIYPYNELRLGYKKKLPIDVDRSRLERHLASDDLMRLFGVTTLEQFYELPEWKRIELKKKAKLF